MENQTQPILCCVGADVAGEPTQFLMERAVAAAHLDWHVITVEVSAEQLAKAWEGMNIMRFQAVRFFPTHQVSAMHLVAEPTPQDRFVGGITSAMRSGDSWTMWHNSGPALLNSLSARFDWSQTICWVHGISMRTRSFLVACKDNRPRKIFWSGSGFGPAKEDAATAEGSTVLPLPEAVSDLPLVVVPQENESEIAKLLMNELNGDSSIRTLVHIGDSDSAHLERLLACQPSGECALAIVSDTPGSRRRLNESWRSGEVHVLTPADLIVAEEAYDQLRWTGVTANLELLREAYEEYADF